MYRDRYDGSDGGPCASLSLGSTALCTRTDCPNSQEHFGPRIVCPVSPLASADCGVVNCGKTAILCGLSGMPSPRRSSDAISGTKRAPRMSNWVCLMNGPKSPAACWGMFTRHDSAEFGAQVFDLFFRRNRDGKGDHLGTCGRDGALPLVLPIPYESVIGILGILGILHGVRGFFGLLSRWLLWHAWHSWMVWNNA